MQPGNGEDEKMIISGQIRFYIHAHAGKQTHTLIFSLAHTHTTQDGYPSAWQPPAEESQKPQPPLLQVSHSLQYVLRDLERSFHHDIEESFKLQTHLKELASCVSLSRTMVPMSKWQLYC